MAEKLTKNSQMESQLIEIQYFGCISYYIQLVKSTYLLLEQFETFQKMSFRNRCQVLGADKVNQLTVPLLGGRDQKTFMREIRIDNNQHWQLQHWRNIESCYNKSAFFLHYKDELKYLLFTPFETLWELDEASIRWVISKLKMQTEVIYTGSFEKQSPAHCLDLRNHFLPANRNTHSLNPYQQVFEKPFETNLCILDLLFNMGPQSIDYLLNQLLVKTISF